MTNSDAGMALVAEIMQAIGREYGWPGFAPRVITPIAMAVDTMRRYTGVYSRPGTPFQLSISVEDGRLMATQAGAAPFELLPTGRNVFTPAVDAPPFRFERDAAGNVAALVVGGTRLARMP